MSDIKEAMRLIGGIAPTPQQIQRVQAIAHSLHVAENDPMLSILIALDCYHGVFSDLPNKAIELAESAAVAASTQAKIAADRTVTETMTALTPKVQEAMGQVVSQVATRQMFQWGAGALIVSALLMAATFWYAHSTGLEAGRGLGYAEVKDEKAAAAWANTPEGRTAYRFAQSGELQRLARCEGKGWEIKKRICYPSAVPLEGTYGWTLP